MEHLDFSAVPSFGGEHVMGGDTIGEDTEEIVMDPQELWQRIISAMSDEELGRTQAELEARIDDLGYREGLGVTDVVEPEDLQDESELQDCLAAVGFEQGARLARRQLGF